MPMQPAPDRRDDHGPFDIVGDVHGCADELGELLARLGYGRAGDGWRHPRGRRPILVGDLVDRGPRIADTLDLVMAAVAAGRALCVVGNHDDKLRRALLGRAVQVAHGLDRSLAEIAARPPAYAAAVAAFIAALPSHLVLDEGRLVVAHAGLPEALHGRDTKRVRAFCLYGAATGRLDAHGLPVRGDWGSDYRGKAAVVYGHTPLRAPRWVNNTINIDTGCVFGGRLTALRWPERELAAVGARRAYAFSPAFAEVPGGDAA